MKVKMMRDAGGKLKDTVHDLTKWAAANFVRMHAAKYVCSKCGEAPQNIDNHPCVPREMPDGLNRAMPRGVTR